jgi:ATP-dependent RNA helicase RhlE
MTTFTDLQLAEPLTRALAADGYEIPTPIQLQAIPPLLAGRDLLGIAQTGTGKTAAFALPILHRLAAAHRRPAPRTCRALILAPTRELALQIAESFTRYGRFMALRTTCVFGGVSERPQIQALHGGVDILVATPGRLLDLIGQRAVSLGALDVFVLDEADRMLDMGFIHDVRRIVRLLPAERQTALLSATMPGDIAQLARDLLRDPVKVEVAPPATTVERVTQQVLFVDTADKRELLVHLLQDDSIRRALVFTRTKHAANKVAGALEKAGIAASAIHGNKSQGARQKALALFKAGQHRVLVATDIAARGIDIDDVTHVINFDLPNEPESYVHRIGRTARAGAEGAAIALCDAGEVSYLRDIERTTRQKVPVRIDHPFHHTGIANGSVTAPPPASLQSRHRQGGARRNASAPPHGRGDDRRGMGRRGVKGQPVQSGEGPHRDRHDDAGRTASDGDRASRRRADNAGRASPPDRAARGRQGRDGAADPFSKRDAGTGHRGGHQGGKRHGQKQDRGPQEGHRDQRSPRRHSEVSRSNVPDRHRGQDRAGHAATSGGGNGAASGGSWMRALGRGHDGER